MEAKIWTIDRSQEALKRTKEMICQENGIIGVSFAESEAVSDGSIMVGQAYDGTIVVCVDNVGVVEITLS